MALQRLAALARPCTGTGTGYNSWPLFRLAYRAEEVPWRMCRCRAAEAAAAAAAKTAAGALANQPPCHCTLWLMH